MPQHARAWRRPDGWIGRAKQHDACCARRRGEMADAGVVADKLRTALQRRAEHGQRPIVGVANGFGFWSTGMVRFGFTGDDEERLSHAGDVFGPAIQRPVFAWRTAAWMECDEVF